jgi:DNA (cytosine-5)-methyltransferase 1
LPTTPPNPLNRTAGKLKKIKKLTPLPGAVRNKSKMNHIGLFEGIGGFSLAAEWMGWETIAWCEINRFCQKILKQHFPKATGHGDIKTTDFSIYRGQCDIVTGGFPCQPYSVAGERKGRNDDRHLWPQMLRAIKEIQPSWVVPENVPGIIDWDRGLVFDEIWTDLETEGYEVLPLLLPACSVNAFHKRNRIWFVAHLDSKRVEEHAEKQILRKQNIPSRQIGESFQEAERRFDTFESRLCRTIHGIPNGVDRIKALGNAVVPQLVFQIFKAIEQFNLCNKQSSGK